MRHKPGNRDIIVIGASAGGLQALQHLMKDLPADLPAAVFVVMHIGTSTHLAGILDRAGGLPVSQAKSGDPIETGHVYVAAPDMHLLLHDGHLLLRRGPRENLARPAIDPLFRTAACTFGARVIGVVLSGALNDGTAGLQAVKRCGGIAIIQDPADALVPDMPLSAKRYVDVDYSVPIAEMGDLLARLVAEPAGKTPEIPFDVKVEATIATQELADMDTEDRLGVRSRFSCPECHGSLWEIGDGRILRYRCHIGHAFTGHGMMAAQAQEVEQLLEKLLRSHSERAELARRMAERERTDHRDRLADRLEERARDYQRDAELMRELLVNRDSDLIALRGGPEPAE
ncbi:MAG: two-component system, chemotaxis family, protein-glutamate methylesterase/glutaminase [Rhodospirillaceae bacterium]|nr:two-component system, chemotaxis family, protein-glutamate methylesterase/glutaminase [Rhodospirillaceae bacterium]